MESLQKTTLALRHSIGTGQEKYIFAFEFILVELFGSRAQNGHQQKEHTK